MRVGVLGGAGYIGSHVVLALQEAGHEPIIFDNLSTGLQENVDATGASFVKGDITDREAVEAFFARERPEAVIHLAARKAVGESMEHPELYAEQNLSGTIAVLNAMRRHGCDHIIFSSSAAVYGSPQYLPLDEDHPTAPESFYGFTKREVERILEWYARLTPLHYVSLRYFNAVGYDPGGRITGKEREPQNLFPILFEAATGVRDAVTIFGDDYDTRDGTCVRDYIHVTDLADAHVRALSHLQEHDSLTVNLGTGDGLTVRECVDAVQEEMGAFPVEVGPRRAGDPAVVYAKALRAEKVLGWRPEHSDLPTIVSTMAAVYR